MKDFLEVFFSVIAGVVIFICIALLGAAISEDVFMQEGAMEVYKGNTTLEYKVVDGVKVDSCVIFLKK